MNNRAILTTLLFSTGVTEEELFGDFRHLRKEARKSQKCEKGMINVTFDDSVGMPIFLYN